LIKRGFLAKKAGSEKIGLGPTVSQMCKVFSVHYDLISFATPYLEKLSSQFRETALLTVIDRKENICLTKIEPDRLIRFTIDSGTKLPLYCGASSMILLAYQNRAFIDSYLESEPPQSLPRNPITDTDQLRQKLSQVRKDGYAYSNSEVDDGAVAISAPVFNHHGKLSAGLTVAGPADRIDGELVHKIILAVKDNAAELSAEMGYHNV